jgi:phosphoribosyl 1,2-cyclic phosphate phosphodiesterase
MKVTILGSGGSTGVPMIGGADGSGDWGACDPAEPRNRRTRASIVIENSDNQRLLIDTTPDLREQLLACRIPAIHAVLFTHAHADHIAGIDDVRMLNRIIDLPLQAHGMQRTLDEITRRFGYAFAPWSGPGFYRPVLLPSPTEAGATHDILGMRVSLFRQGHGRVETLGLRIGRFAYSTDVVELDEAAFAVLAGIDTWVVGCFLPRDRHWTHANLPTVLEWVDRLRPRRTILTHMGPSMDWGWLTRTLPFGVEPGYDGQVIELPAP